MGNANNKVLSEKKQSKNCPVNVGLNFKKRIIKMKRYSWGWGVGKYAKTLGIFG